MTSLWILIICVLHSIQLTSASGKNNVFNINFRKEAVLILKLISKASRELAQRLKPNQSN